MTAIPETSGIRRLGPTWLAVVLALSLATVPWTGLGMMVAAGGLVVALAEPLAGLVVLPFVVPFGSLVAGSLGSWVAPALLVGVVILAGVHRALTQPRGAFSSRSSVVWTWGLLPVGVYGLALVASAWSAVDWGEAGTELLRWGLYALAVGVAATVASGSRRGPWLLGAMVAAGGLEAAAGVQGAMSGAGPEAFGFGRFVRAYGHFGQPNPFGAYMNMVWPLAAAVVMSTLTDGRRKGAGLAVIGAGALAICVAGLGMSGSRGAWLGAGAAGVAMAVAWVWRWVLRGQVPWVALVGGWLVVVGGLGWLGAGGIARVPDVVGQRVGSSATELAGSDVSDAEVTDANFATVERLAHWQAALAMWQERPWLGQGPGAFASVYNRFRLPRWPDALGHAHNYYLNALAETGLLGLAAYLVLVLASLALALRAAVWPRDAWEGAVGLGLVGVLAAVAVHSVFDHLYVHNLSIHLGLVVGLGLGAGLGRAEGKVRGSN